MKTRTAAAYTIAFLALTFPFWLQGEVAAPDRGYLELGAPEPPPTARVENRKFGDYWTAFLPAIDAQIAGPRSGWIATWSAANALGRPASHLSGFSPAYLPSMILARVVRSPERFLTVLSLASTYLAGLFVLLACREMGRSASASLLAGASVAGSPFFMYWLPFPMFAAVWCWSAGALWGIARMARTRDLASWSIVAFSAYSLLMTAYPQPVVYHAYLLGGYAAYLALRAWGHGGTESAARFVLALASAVSVAAVLAMPVYADLAGTAARSARVSADPSFFTSALPIVDSAGAAAQWLALASFPELFGNPVSPAFPFAYDGLSMTPLVAFLAVVALMLRLRQGLGWWMAIGAIVALALVHPLYLLGVKHLGFNLSRSTPLGTLMLPMAMVAAQGADALLRRENESRARIAAALGVACVVGLLVLAVAFGMARGVPMRWGVAAIGVAIVLAFAAQVARPLPAALFAALAAIGAYSSFPLMLREPPAAIAHESPLVEALRANLAPGSRFAVASPGIDALKPNVNATLGLASVHSYDSLSSRSYQALLAALGGRTTTYGRWNDSIAPGYGSAPFWMSDVSVVLSRHPIADGNLAPAGVVDGVRIYRVRERMGCCIELPLAVDASSVRSAGFPDPADTAIARVQKAADQGDRFELVVRGERDSLVVLSQAFHPDWRARVLSAGGWSDARTLAVGDFFEGVVVPRGARRVEMEFRPWARYAWIAHGFWVALLVVFVFRLRRKE